MHVRKLLSILVAWIRAGLLSWPQLRTQSRDPACLQVGSAAATRTTGGQPNSGASAVSRAKIRWSSCSVIGNGPNHQNETVRNFSYSEERKKKWTN